MFWRRLVMLLLVFLNALLLFRLVWSEQGLFAYMTLKNRHDQLKAQIAEVDRTGLDLSQEIRRLKSDRAYQEQVIRERLKYVKDNEILYLFSVDADKTPGEGADEKID